MVYGLRPRCFKIEAAARTVLPVPPLFAVGTPVESSETSDEIVFTWFEKGLTSRGSSNRPRNKDVVVVVALVVVFCVVVDWDMVESQYSES